MFSFLEIIHVAVIHVLHIRSDLQPRWWWRIAGWRDNSSCCHCWHTGSGGSGEICYTRRRFAVLNLRMVKLQLLRAAASAAASPRPARPAASVPARTAPTTLARPWSTAVPARGPWRLPGLAWTRGAFSRRARRRQFVAPCRVNGGAGFGSRRTPTDPILAN